MRLFQFALIGFPDRRAASVQTARMAAAFEAIGVEATLVYQAVGSPVAIQDIPLAYGLRAVPRHLALPFGRIAARLPGERLSRAALRAAVSLFASRASDGDVYLGRHPHRGLTHMLLEARARRRTRASVFVEIHEAGHFHAGLDAHVAGYIAINVALAEALQRNGVGAERIVVARNGVDVERYREFASRREQLREELRLPRESVCVCYTGQLFAGRNIGALIAALGHLDPAFMIVLVGGEPQDIARLRQEAVSAGVESRVRFVGHQTADVASQYQCASDVVVIPYGAEKTPTAQWCSPLKAAEYLASGTPIAAFPLPALQQLYREGEVEWATDDSPPALARAISVSARHPHILPVERGGRLAGLSWTARAQRITEFIHARLAAVGRC